MLFINNYELSLFYLFIICIQLHECTYIEIIMSVIYCICDDSMPIKSQDRAQVDVL
jgi:hypothetical protein